MAIRQEIKDRIEIIRQGRLPEGYKRTKIGVIPKRWKLMCLSDINAIYTGSTPPRGKSAYFNGEIPWVKTTDLNNSHIYNTEEAISQLAVKETAVRIVKKNSILIAMYGGFNQIGRTGLLTFNGATNQAIASFYVDEKQYNAEFVLHWLNAKREVWKTYAASSRKDPNITKKDVEDFPIVKPKYVEQQKIAAILSTWDRAIELKEQLIEEKKKLKKGLIQNLLAGKVRLPGFEGKWKLVKAEELFQNITDKSHKGLGVVLSSTQDKGIIPRDEIDINIKFDKSNLSNYKKVCIGDFVISLQSFQGGIEYSTFEGLVSPAYVVLRNKIPIAHSFYKYLFKTTDFVTRLNGLIYGIRDGKQIGYRDFSALKLPYPNVDEQKEIGKLIDKATKEIEILEEAKEVLILQKKGLMQLLLTGIVRVPVDNLDEGGETCEKQSV